MLVAAALGQGCARPALAAEADRLNMRTGGTVLAICRTYRTDEGAGEIADIVIPVERYSLSMESRSAYRTGW